MRIADCASVIRSKNAGPFEITIDVLFDDAAAFAAACRSDLVEKEALARWLRIDAARVLDVLAYRPAMAVKINLQRAISSGTNGDRDVYGTQQFIPLLDIEIPLEDRSVETR